MKQVTKTTLIVVDFENYLDELVFRSVVEEGNEVLVQGASANRDQSFVYVKVKSCAHVSGMTVERNFLL